MILAEISMFPLDKGESVSTYVARSLDIIDRSGLPYRLGAMGTEIEGEWDEVMGVIRRCFEQMREDCRRIECSISIDYRKDGAGRLAKKVEAVEQRLGRKLGRQ